MTELIKAKLMYRLARSKGNWGAKYDRLEHLKRFGDLKQIIKELSKKGWLIVIKKPSYTGLSLNSKYKKEIIEFIGKHIPIAKETIQ